MSTLSPVKNSQPVVPEMPHPSVQSTIKPKASVKFRSFTNEPKFDPSLPRHHEEVINQKWAVKKAKEDARHHKRCDRLDRRYGKATWESSPNPKKQSKHQQQMEKLEMNHAKKKMYLENRQAGEIASAKSKALAKAKKDQQHVLGTKTALPLVDVQVGADGATEAIRSQPKSKPKCPSSRRAFPSSMESAATSELPVPASELSNIRRASMVPMTGPTMG